MSLTKSDPTAAVPTSLNTQATDPLPLPPEGVDRKTGRAIPISDSEWQQRCAALEAKLAEIDAHDATPEETYELLMRNIDEERRRQGRPPAFHGQH